MNVGIFYPDFISLKCLNVFFWSTAKEKKCDLFQEWFPVPGKNSASPFL